MDPTPAHEGQTLPTGNTPQAAGQPAIPRAILEDRWEGLFSTDDGTNSSEHVGEAERRYLNLAETLADIIARVSRNRSAEDDIGQGGITDEVYDLIREAIISRVHDRGYAR